MLSPTASSSPPTPERQRAAVAIARIRAALDAMLVHPDWEGAFARAAAQLGFKGPRQGVGPRKALLSLPIERKFAAIRHALDHQLEAPAPSEARKLASLWGADARPSNHGRSRLSARQWEILRRALRLRLGVRHAAYKEAQTLLFQSYHPLVEPCVQRLCRRTRHRPDARQEARLGLLEAIDRVQELDGFESYLRQWIARRIQNFLTSETTPVTAPINLLSQSLRQAEPPPPGTPAARFAEALRQGVVQLDAPLPETGQPSFEIRDEASPQPDRAAESSDQALYLREALNELTPKQREVLALRFGLEPASAAPLSLAMVARRVGISRQQVFQREKRALSQLAKRLAPAARELALAQNGRSLY